MWAAANVAVVALLVVGAAGDDLPFFLEQTAAPESKLQLKSEDALRVACTEYREAEDPQALFESPNSRIAYETVCGSQDDAVDPLRETCQANGWLPPVSSIASVCELNALHLDFLKCWGPGGLLLRLVENELFTNHVAAFGALKDVVEEHRAKVQSDDNSFSSCFEATDPVEPGQPALAEKVVGKTINALEALAQNRIPMVSLDPFEDLALELEFDPALICSKHQLVFADDPKVENATAAIDREYASLSLCAARFRSALIKTFGAFPDALAEVGCHVDRGEYSTHFRFKKSRNCQDLEDEKKTPNFECVLGNRVLNAVYIHVNNAEDTAYTTLYKDFEFAGTGGKGSGGFFACKNPWVPRGEPKSDVCSTQYADALLDSAAPAVTTLVRSGSERECLEACTLAPFCTGYVWDAVSSSKCVLTLDKDSTELSRTRLSSRFPLLTTLSSGTLAVATSQVRAQTPFAQRNTVIADHDDTEYPKLVYGQMKHEQLDADLGDFATVTKSKDAFLTPEECGVECAALDDCYFAVWLNSRWPCYYYNRQSSGSFPGNEVFATSGACANIGAFHDPDPDLGESSKPAVCGAAPMCTWSSEYGCIDVYRSAMGVYSAVPTTVPVVYAVPDPDAGNHAAAWCPSGRICESCSSEECADAEFVIFPATVDTFGPDNSANCPAMRRAAVMSSEPTFAAGSFSGCPLLERIQMGNTKCFSGTSCTATFESGAVPSCVGHSPVFGYSLDSSDPNDAEATTSAIAYEAASIDCVPCDPSDTAKYAKGRAEVPPEVVSISGNVLAECASVTRVSVPADTTFATGFQKKTSAFWSPVLQALSVQGLTGAELSGHHSIVPRCLMNAAGTVAAVPHQASSDDTECLPCVSDAESGDLSIPWYVESIPQYAFSECNIPGTIRFQTNQNGAGIRGIESNAFDMSCPFCPTGNTIGRVEIPATLDGFRDKTQQVGLGDDAFRASGFETFRVALPRLSDTSKDQIPDELFTAAFWNSKVPVATSDGTGCSITGTTSTPSSVVSVQGGKGCSPLVFSSRLQFDLLFGVCDCSLGKPGCFYSDEANPVAILENATLQNCPDQSRVGPLIVPVYAVLLPRNPTILDVTSRREGCAYTFSVVEPPGIHTDTCDVCSAETCVPSSDEGFTVSGETFSPADFVSGDDGEETAVETTDDDDALSTAAVIAIVSVGSLSGLVLLMDQFNKRRKGR